MKHQSQICISPFYMNISCKLIMGLKAPHLIYTKLKMRPEQKLTSSKRTKYRRKNNVIYSMKPGSHSWIYLLWQLGTRDKTTKIKNKKLQLDGWVLRYSTVECAMYLGMEITNFFCLIFSFGITGLLFQFKKKKKKKNYGSNTVVTLGSSLFSLTPKVFWWIPSFVSKIRLFVKGILIFFVGFTEFQHSKSITKPKFELQQHLALQCDDLPEIEFYKKK